MAELGSRNRPPRMLGAVLLVASVACTEPRSEPEALADTAPDATRPGVETAPAPPESDLYLIDPQTGAAEVLLRAPGAQTNAELSPDGERVVYESWLDDTAQIFVLEPDGTTQQLTYGSGGAHDPTWSPDGTQIAFASRPRKGSDADIFLMDADGSRIRRLVGTPRNDGHPDWSPDGSRIAFHSRFRTRDVPTGRIWVAAVRLGAPTQLTRSDQNLTGVDPAWSPDGRWIAYTSLPGSSINGELPYTELGLMRPDFTHARRIGKPGARDYDFSENPSWSPDGSWIVFQNQPGPLRTINVRTERLRTFPDIVDDEQPSWGLRGIIVSLTTIP